MALPGIITPIRTKARPNLDRIQAPQSGDENRRPNRDAAATPGPKPPKRQRPIRYIMSSLIRDGCCQAVRGPIEAEIIYSGGPILCRGSRKSSADSGIVGAIEFVQAVISGAKHNQEQHGSLQNQGKDGR